MGIFDFWNRRKKHIDAENARFLFPGREVFWRQIRISKMKMESVAILSPLRLFGAKRLLKKMGQTLKPDFQNLFVKNLLIF